MPINNCVSNEQRQLLVDCVLKFVFNSRWTWTLYGRSMQDKMCNPHSIFFINRNANCSILHHNLRINLSIAISCFTISGSGLAGRNLSLEISCKTAYLKNLNGSHYLYGIKTLEKRWSKYNKLKKAVLKKWIQLRTVMNLLIRGRMIQNICAKYNWRSRFKLWNIYHRWKHSYFASAVYVHT